MSDVEGAELACYCGLYCGACAIKNGQISNTAKSLKAMLAAYDYGEWVHMVADVFPVVNGWKEFDGVLGWLTEQDCPACRGGGGPPMCEIRLCAQQNGLAGCWECDRDPCDKLAMIDSSPVGPAKNRQRIREVGLAAWLAEQKSLVNGGYSYFDVRQGN